MKNQLSRRNVLGKLGADNRTDAVRLAAQRGLVRL